MLNFLIKLVNINFSIITILTRQYKISRTISKITFVLFKLVSFKRKLNYLSKLIKFKATKG